MKKYLILFSMTTLTIVSIILYGAYFKHSIINTDVISVELSDAENIIVCSGKIQYANKEDIYTNIYAIPDKIFVKVGDIVHKGDIVMNINKAILQEPPSPLNSNITNSDGISNIHEVYNSLINSNIDAYDISHPKYILTGETISITSPSDGKVVSINIKNNELIDPKKSAITLTNTNNLNVNLNVNESQASEISIGQDVCITGAGFKHSEYRGVVKEISNEAEQILTPTGTESTILVKVEVLNAGKDIKPGFTAKCKIITSKDKDKLIIPYEVVRSDEKGNEFVYKYINGLAEKVYIKTEKEYPQGISIGQGIECGEVIISNPDLVYNKCRVIPIIK